MIDPINDFLNGKAQKWTKEEWAEYDKQRVAEFEASQGYRPVRSKNCCGCPSWPFALCWPCRQEMDKAYAARGLGTDE